MSVPKLRFKEFDGYWNKNTIGNFVLNYKGGASLTPADFVDYSECEVIPKKAISSGGALQLDKDVPTFCTPEFFNLNQNYVVDSEYLITTLRDLVPSGPSIGYIVKYEGDKQYILAQGVYGFRIKNDLCRDFLIQFSNTSKFRLHMQSIMVGSTQVHIRNHDYFSTELYTPSLLEQTQIASFLSAVDEKISQLTQKHQLLSQYKQGMMQKLFSQQIRFKADDGSEFGEWDEYSLDTLLSKIIDNRGKTPVTEANLEIPLIEVNAIGQRRIKYEKVSKYFSEDTFQNWFRAYLEHQDILFSTVGNTAICSIYTEEIKAGIAQNIVGLRANTKLIQPTFLYYLLTEISNNQKFKSIEMQAVQPSIKVSQMIHLTFLTPCLEEQTKIANFLTSIDQKIEVTEQQIEQAKQWKKGLLQQMFV